MGERPQLLSILTGYVEAVGDGTIPGVNVSGKDGRDPEGWTWSVKRKPSLSRNSAGQGDRSPTPPHPTRGPRNAPAYPRFFVLFSNYDFPRRRTGFFIACPATCVTGWVQPPRRVDRYGVGTAVETCWPLRRSGKGNVRFRSLALLFSRAASGFRGRAATFEDKSALSNRKPILSSCRFVDEVFLFEGIN